MSFPLESFEASLPAGIVRKGEAYWTDDTVKGLTSDGNQWKALVYGSEKYSVCLRVLKNEVEAWSCNCPYNLGPICKHVVALLFAIRERKNATIEQLVNHPEISDSSQSIEGHTAAREMAIQAAMHQQQYEEAYRLAYEGIEEDTDRELPGLVKKWKTYLLKIAEVTNDQAAQIKFLEQLFFSAGDMSHYRRLKELYSEADFGERIEQYLSHFRMRARQYFPGENYFDERVANVLEEENRKGELMEEVAEAPDVYRLDHYFPLLAKQFPKPYLEAYDQAVRNEMKQSATRKAYHNCCTYLQKMEEMGGQELVAQIVVDWRKRYRHRQELLEELADWNW